MKCFVPRAFCAAVLTVGLVGGPVGADAQISTVLTGPVSKSPTITIHSYTYSVPSKVRVGSRIIVVNQDVEAHTVTSHGDHGRTFSVQVEAGATGHFKAPGQPGSYKFICKFHRFMRAVLVVK